jgi:hypothetical protein
MSQIFKSTFDKQLLFNFLEKICDKTDKYYLLDSNAYKRANMHNELEFFLNIIKPFYYNSKIFYIERDITYNKLCTIIRQICNLNSISFSTKIIYSKSKYSIPYHIYF